MQTFSPYFPPKGMTFNDLLQLAEGAPVTDLREDHALIEKASTDQLRIILPSIGMDVPDSDQVETLRAAFYQQFYQDDFLARLISFIPAEVNQLFIRQPYIHQSNVHPDDWRAAVNALEAFASVGVFDRIDDEEGPGFAAKPAYIEVLVREAQNDNFRTITEWNILAIDAMNNLMAIFGYLPIQKVAEYLKVCEIDFFSTDEEWLHLAQQAPSLLRNFFIDEDHFLLKRYGTKQRQEILLKSQAQYDPFPITGLDQLFALTNDFYQQIPVCPLANYLVQLSFKYQLPLPRGFAVRLIMDVCEDLVPRTELFLQFFSQWGQLEEEEAQTIHRHFLSLIRQKHIPELNGHSTITVEEWLKTHDVKKSK